VEDVRAALLRERQSLMPWENVADSEAWIDALSMRSRAELEALLVRVRRTKQFDDSVVWLQAASVGLPRALYEGALLIYRDSSVLSWNQCVELARLLSWPLPRFREWNITA
jgi:hypothetical protein